MRADIRLDVRRSQLFPNAPGTAVVGEHIAGIGIWIAARIGGGPETAVIETIGVVVDHPVGIAEERSVNDPLPVSDRHHRMRDAARQVQGALELVLRLGAVRVVGAERDAAQR